MASSENAAENPTEVTTCPDCGGELGAILMVASGEGYRHNVLEYAAVDAKAGFWTGRYPTQGYVSAELCRECGRIVLRAYPKK